MKLTKSDERDILIYAFRYAIGRMTFSSLTMSEIIVNNWSEISTGDKELFKREIQEAIDSDRAGMACDVASWQKVLDLK